MSDAFIQYVGRVQRGCSTCFMLVHHDTAHIITQDARRARDVVTRHRLIWLVQPIDAELLRDLARQEGCAYIVRVKNDPFS